MRYSYQRISTNDKQSMLRQEKFAKDNDIPIINWYQEKASGAKDDRQVLKKLMGILQENDELFVSEASRLTRSMKFLLNFLDFARDKKIKLVMGDFILDCTGKISVFTQGQILMLGLLSEMQRLMIVDAVNEGLAAAREKNNGINPGGQPKLTIQRLCIKNPNFMKYYALYKNRQIIKTVSELARVSHISRSTAYNYLHLIECSEPRDHHVL